MRNLIKKSLAFLLVATLALACFVGTLTVSAADAYNANISVTANPVTLGDTEATAIINVAMVEENVGINEALIKVTSTIGAVAKEVELVKDAAGTAYSEEELTALDYVVDYVGNDISDYGLFYLSAKTATYAIPAAFIKVTFTVGADIAAGTYAINIDVPESKVIAATPDEVAVNFIYDNENPVCFTVEDKVVEPDCEHKWEVAEAVAATETTTGTLVLDCAKCDATETNTVTYNRFARANTRSMILEAEISISADVYDRDLVRCNAAGANGVCSEYIVQFVEDREGVEPKYAYSADAKPMTNSSNGRTYGMLTYGLRSVDMVNAVTMTVFAKVDGQWVTGEVYSDSVQTKANSLLSAAGTPAKTKTLLVDMLQYGAAAQIKFKINTENLPSIAGYESLASTGTVSYTNNRSWASSSSEAAPFTATGISLELSSKILLRPNLQFGNKYYANYADKYDGMKIVVAYTNFQGKEIEQEYVNVTVDPEGEYVFESTDGVRKFSLSLDIFTSADLRQTYTIKAYTADGQLLNTDIISSVESDALSIRNSAVTSGDTDLVNLLDAMMRYGDSANKAFS